MLNLLLLFLPSLSLAQAMLVLTLLIGATGDFLAAINGMHAHTPAHTHAQMSAFTLCAGPPSAFEVSDPDWA